MNQAKIAGGRRIKQNKRKTKQVISSVSHENYLKSINILNEKIINMKDNDYIKFRDFSTQLVDVISKELKRVDFKDRKEFRIFKEDRLKFLYSKLFTPKDNVKILIDCLLYTSPSPRDAHESRMPSSA